MKYRCENPASSSFARYGERGIAVCERWQDFAAFYEDMGPSNGLTIDRIDPDGHYEPGNCRWLDAAENSRRRRPSHPSGEKHGNHKLRDQDVLEIRAARARGEPLVHFAERLGVSTTLVYMIANRRAWTHL